MKCEVDWLRITDSYTWGGMNNNSAVRQPSNKARPMPEDFQQNSHLQIRFLMSMYICSYDTVRKWRAQLNEKEGNHGD